MRPYIKSWIAGSLATLAASVTMHSAAEAAKRHSPAVLDVAEQQCKDRIGNVDFCNCAISKLKKYVNPKYDTLFTYTVGNESIQYFDLNSDIPENTLNKIDAKITMCRRRHAPPPFGLE